MGISAEEIADCNLKLILGMIWMLILRFQIEDISVEGMSVLGNQAQPCARENLVFALSRSTRCGHVRV